MHKHGKMGPLFPLLRAPLALILSAALLSVVFADGRQQSKTQEMPKPQGPPQSGGASTGGVFAPVLDEKHRPITAGGFVEGAPVIFVDDTKKSGLDKFKHVSGTPEKNLILEAPGSGVAIFDYDNDGWPDIFFVNGTTLPGFPGENAPSNHLYHNNHDGTFTDVTVTAGLSATGWGQGVCVVDYDRDGYLDLIVANYADFDLLHAPVPGTNPTCLWKGIAVFCGPRGLPASKNILYRNLGNGHFQDVTASSHIDRTMGHYCFSVSSFDYDDDGWPDIYVACDSAPSILYHNNHDGTFTDVGILSGVAYNADGREQAGMGSTVADYDGDGYLDLFRT